MVLAGLIEAPVLGDTQRGVVVPLHTGVGVSGANGGDLHHEVRRLALLGDDITISHLVGNGIDVERNEQVGPSAYDVAAGRAWFQDNVALSGDQRSVGVAEVLDKVVGAAGPV